MALSKIVNINIYRIFDLVVMATIFVGVKTATKWEPSSLFEVFHSENKSSNVIFPVGTVVEVLHTQQNSTSTTLSSFPAVVTGIIHGANEYRYHVTNSVNLMPTENVEPKYVWEYQIYEKDTVAECNVGSKKQIIMVPCTILSHTMHGDGNNFDDVMYRVKIRMDNQDEDEIDLLSRLKVQRVIEQ